ncbi:MAG: cache domain-containing protein [Candidatus Poribacteria bacterium]|nr:cache domain-containing protein [Candidatus Poribacteria bacterium]
MRFFFFLLLVVGLAAFSLTGCDRAMRKPVMESGTPTETPAPDDPGAFAVAFVQAAIDLYKMEGRETAVAYYNDPASVSGQWYVFIVDDKDFTVSHAIKPVVIGVDVKDLISFVDYPLGLEIVKATEAGHWIDYLEHNPEANKLQLKRTWVMRYDGYIFGSGYYQPWSPDPATLLSVSKDDPEAFTRAVVLAAVARYELDGPETTAAYYNDPANIDGQWYVLITDDNDIYVAHPLRPDFIGKDIKDIPGLDGTPLGAEIARATEAGLWIAYDWPNPESGEIELKRTWAIRHDGYLFGSGYYEPAAGNAMPETN